MLNKIVSQKIAFFTLTVLAGLWISSSASGESIIIKMSTTTSTENSGLLDVLLPAFTKDTGIRVKVFAKGTGAAIRDGKDGNVDIIFVHAKEREERFVADGFGAYRLGVMHNDFVILGPPQDPARVKGTPKAVNALRLIAEARAKFVSRGDDSGTHTKEQRLWKATKFPLKTQTTEIIKKGKKTSLSFQYPDRLGQWYLFNNQMPILQKNLVL